MRHRCAGNIAEILHPDLTLRRLAGAHQRFGKLGWPLPLTPAIP